MHGRFFADLSLAVANVIHCLFKSDGFSNAFFAMLVFNLFLKIFVLFGSFLSMRLLLSQCLSLFFGLSFY
jgi:hypothetical protein